MNDTNKPPLGARPYYIAAENRIKELAQAISRYADTGMTENITEWAQEIILQCALLEVMQD